MAVSAKITQGDLVIGLAAVWNGAAGPSQASGLYDPRTLSQHVPTASGGVYAVLDTRYKSGPWSA